MVKYENQCCGCATESYPCIGNSCPNRNVPVLVCDECGFEEDILYEYDGQQLCKTCVLGKLDKITCGRG